MRTLRLQIDDANITGAARQFQGLRLHPVNTNGNGACAIHAAFGQDVDADGNVFKPDARQFLRQQLGDSHDICETRVNDPYLFQTWVDDELWKDIIAPLCRQAIGLSVCW